jgi:hypothetical protein
MKAKRFTKGNISNIDRIEKVLNIKLPKDYKDFLIENNGADIEKGVFYIEDIDQTIPMGYFYGVDIVEGYADIIEINKEYADDILENSILIGSDEGEGWILLVCDGENDGIWYYDHSYFFEQSTDDLNTYFICDTFSDFIKLLETTLD